MMHWLLTIPPWQIATPAAVLVAFGGWWVYCRGVDAGRQQGKEIGKARGFEEGREYQRDVYRQVAAR